MIKLVLSENIIKKHIRYIINSNIEQDFNNLKSDTEFLEEIRKGFGYIFVEEHEKFCAYIIRQINNLRQNCESLDKVQNNLFIAQPKKLRKYIQNIKKKFPNISNTFCAQSEEALFYSKLIFECVGYEKFSCSDMKEYYYSEKLFLERFTKKYISGELSIIKRQLGGRKYGEIHYKRFFKSVKDEIARLGDTNKDDSQMQELFKNLVIELEKINMSNNSKKFISETKDIFNKYYNKLHGENLENKVISTKNYKMYCQKNNVDINEWNAYHFIMELGLKACPYCNRQYITPIYSENGKMRADLDHFYAKSKYPYLSLSIYNLVPCCKFCNSSLKGDKEFSYDKNISPYDKGFDEILKFSFVPRSFDSFYGKDDVIIKLLEVNGCDKKDLDKAINNSKTFEIENLYQYHTNIVKSLIIKRLIYDESYLDFLVEKFRNILIDREHAIDLLITNIDIKDIQNTPLAKLINDVKEELDFI